MDERVLLAVRRWQAHQATQRAMLGRLTAATREATESMQKLRAALDRNYRV